MTNISMTDIDTWPLDMAVNVFGGGFLVAWGCLLWRFYIGRKYLGRVIEAFGRSPEVREWEARYGRGLFNRYILFSILAGFVIFPRIYIKRGVVSARDIQDFPRDLKRVLMVDIVLLCVSSIILIVLGVLVDLRSGA